ncbi:DUF4132 domain-containing protein [Thorsellia anophelis]|uniref:DUF4132 domain-containing protein n=1 Tax=Thorsellia anophelis DSM 18579 TaxID=1123402 RepID=A0A1H9YTC4_9GAMM|nr:DUF4132 domain-containing protein [Thorsellia anophelis]SES72314.1 protein of unknown function [Thorsellia anophelis DSM 18579]
MTLPPVFTEQSFTAKEVQDFRNVWRKAFTALLAGDEEKAAFLPETIRALPKPVIEFASQLFPSNTSGHNASGMKLYFTLESASFAAILPLIPEDLWQNEDYLTLFTYLYGAERLPLVKHTWHKIPEKIYQYGYYRRSFRAPQDSQRIRVNQLNFLSNICQPSRWYDNNNNKWHYYQLSLVEQIRYDHQLYQTSQMLLWSAALDLEYPEIYQTFEDIIFNKDNIGKVSVTLIQALLNSEKVASWQLVEKLLLAAQRQEGLRQMILESLDETSIGALTYMIQVILEHKLTRFSSLVRAVDTWTGLGWEAEKERVVKDILSLAHTYLQQPALISQAIKSKNNNEVYMALWAQGVFDIEKTQPHLNYLVQRGNVEKKLLAIKFASEINIPTLEIPFYLSILNSLNNELDDSKAKVGESNQKLMILGALFSRLVELFQQHNAGYADSQLFAKIYALAASIQTQEQSFTGKVFSWLTINFRKSDIYLVLTELAGDNQTDNNQLLAIFDTLAINVREAITLKILGRHYYYAYEFNTIEKPSTLTARQREFCFQVLSDRAEGIAASALRGLSSVQLTPVELEQIYPLLKRKAARVRKNTITLMAKQSDTTLETFIASHLTLGDLEQKIGLLDLILQLKTQQRLLTQIDKWAERYQKENKVSARELTLLQQLTQNGDEQAFVSAENGYGLFDPSRIEAKQPLSVKTDSLYQKRIAKEQYGFSQPLDTIKVHLAALNQLYLAHQYYEYEVEYYGGEFTKVLLSNSLQYSRNTFEKGYSAREIFELLPLWQEWENWYQASGLDPIDLLLLTLIDGCNRKVWRDTLSPMMFFHKNVLINPKQSAYQWDNPAKTILEGLLKLELGNKENQNVVVDFLLDACEQLFLSLPDEILQYQIDTKDSYGYHGDGWQQEPIFSTFLHSAYSHSGPTLKLDLVTTARLFKLYKWRMESGLAHNRDHARPPIELYLQAFHHQLIGEDELYFALCEPSALRKLTACLQIKQQHQFNYCQHYPFLTAMLTRIINMCLDIELIRGDSSTLVTHFSQELQVIFGSQRLVQILVGLDKTNLYRGYIYAGYNQNQLNKQQMFSYLLKRCYPLPTDTQAEFNQMVTQFNIKESRLIEAAIYAPQWQKWVSDFLGWKGLDSAIWWMHAHTKIASYQDVNAENESEIARYSAIDLNEFKNGAVDKEWFTAAYKALGKTRWNILYTAAKYISEGNGHKRARLYADVMTDNLKIREVIAKVKEMRDQDYLRVYGLVPLSKTNPEKDVLTRYEYLQQFKKESREFGAQKQASEALAIQIAMENLARNAGYADPVRLTWSMEMQQVQRILSTETDVILDDLQIKLVVDATGIADLVYSKAGKPLKSLPKAHKKNPEVLSLMEKRKTLREQYKRALRGLEEAMVRGDEFTLQEMLNLLEHPVITHHLQKLVFITQDKQTGFLRDGQLISATGEVHPLHDEAQTLRLRIAHCVDLHLTQEWVAYQKVCFNQQLQQPFKQVFRELYLPTADELAAKTVSHRYAGHQVAPKQTLALLKTRGWKVDYESGLQKVFHKHGFIARIYAVADWFSPADVESPTLETVEFNSLKTGDNVEFSSIAPIIFSEVMRDLDLVVSVAHVGEVDPEASQSSIELRAALLRETVDLFKLKNIEIAGSHALITGSLAQYSIHLGSAVVHQLGGSYLSIIAVPSQHRGRIFLPFMDEDPRTAEIMAKVLLLACDDEIQDPTILQQIRR